MRRDISRILRDWPYEPGKMNARLVDSEDGSPRLQVRLDLGLLQMFLDGRPDGLTPHGFPSLLEYHESRLDATTSPDAAEDVAPFSISVEDCQALWEEGLQYAHRYVALATLDDNDRVVRDTVRNLRLLDFLTTHGPQDERQTLEQFRPYIIMMKHRSLAGLLARDAEPRAAALTLENGMEALAALHEDPKKAEQMSEYRSLKEIHDALLPSRPASRKETLTQALQTAIAEEKYEEAAKLRDELKRLRE
ncbi:MAG: UvrB/UvrC motif-containing protein [Planctomycetes bacterium]|nr:UvrB/UvrC motif-containing protein [Planctomycetota bacterium]